MPSEKDKIHRRGRKPFFDGEPMERISVTMDARTRRKLLVLGNDNISAGIRLAADVAFDRYALGHVARPGDPPSDDS